MCLLTLCGESFNWDFLWGSCLLSQWEAALFAGVQRGTLNSFQPFPASASMFLCCLKQTFRITRKEKKKILWIANRNFIVLCSLKLSPWPNRCKAVAHTVTVRCFGILPSYSHFLQNGLTMKKHRIDGTGCNWVRNYLLC